VQITYSFWDNILSVFQQGLVPKKALARPHQILWEKYVGTDLPSMRNGDRPISSVVSPGGKICPGVPFHQQQAPWLSFRCCNVQALRRLLTLFSALIARLLADPKATVGISFFKQSFPQHDQRALKQ